jgi:NADH:ubiquinone oxidoreductase subunit 2 (subunit N)
MVSLAYYLRVVAAVWMWPEPTTNAASSGPNRVAPGGAPSHDPGAAGPGELPVIAGGSPEADRIPRGSSRCGLIVGSALLCGAATVFFGVIPSPLIDWASHAASSLATTL